MNEKTYEILRDEFAVAFTEWVSLNYFVYNTFKTYVSTKELLEIYKKEIK